MASRRWLAFFLSFLPFFLFRLLTRRFFVVLLSAAFSSHPICIACEVIFPLIRSSKAMGGEDTGAMVHFNAVYKLFFLALHDIVRIIFLDLCRVD